MTPSLLSSERRWRVALSAAVFMALGACEEPVECLVDSRCDPGFVCVNTQCVGTELSPDSKSFTLYKEEMHNRLAADCGICHGVRETPPPVVYGEAPEEDPEPTKVSVRDLIQLPVQAGDSGWRIYLDNLSDERLFASYLDTLQFINKDAPERSLLLAFGRGEININGPLPGEVPADFSPTPHPKVYDVPQEGEPELANCSLAYREVPLTQPMSPADPNQDPPAPPATPAQVSHQRLLGWAKLDHSAYGGLWPYSLEGYKEHLEPVVNAGCGCHKASEDPAVNQRKQGGFCFPPDATTATEVQLWASMINVSDPASSALLHFLNGDFDHKFQVLPTYEDKLPELQEAVTSWINDP